MSSCLISFLVSIFFFFNDTATTEIYTLSLHDALPIYTALSSMAAVASGFTSACAKKIPAKAILVMVVTKGLDMALEGLLEEPIQHAMEILNKFVNELSASLMEEEPSSSLQVATPKYREAFEHARRELIKAGYDGRQSNVYTPAQDCKVWGVSHGDGFNVCAPCYSENIQNGGMAMVEGPALLGLLAAALSPELKAFLASKESENPELSMAGVLIPIAMEKKVTCLFNPQSVDRALYRYKTKWSKVTVFYSNDPARRIGTAEYTVEIYAYKQKFTGEASIRFTNEFEAA